MPWTRRTPSRLREALPALGLASLSVAAVVGTVAAEFVPDDAPPLVVILATVGGLAVGLIAEHTLGLVLERRTRRQVLAKAVETLRTRAPAGLAALLSPHHEEQIVPFIGREALLTSLLDWCTDSKQNSEPFRLITGPGGVGKTRLADEVQRRLQVLDPRWECLFLTAEQGREANAVEELRDHVRERPVLVVVDYAENRNGLRELLTQALGDQGVIRVLLLARTAGNWWDVLTAVPGNLGAALSAGYGGVDLPHIDAAPQTILDTAADAYARRFGIAAPEVRLSGDGDEPRILDLTAAALIGVLTSRERRDPPRITLLPQVEHVTLELVFDEVLRHEANTYWTATATEAGIADRLTVAMRHVLVAAVALLGAKDEPTTVALVRRVLDTFTEEVQPDPVATARWLRKTYPSADESGRWVEPLTPDRLAEHLIVRSLTENRYASRRTIALLENLRTAQVVQAMTVLSRAATDPARSNDQQQAVRSLADHLAERLVDSPGVHGAALRVVPSPSVRMAPTAEFLARRHIELLEAAGKDAEQLAASLSGLAIFLTDLGRLSDALPPAQRAVTVYERLAKSDPERFEPDLAGSLSYLSRRLWEVGRAQESLPVAARAVAIHERLAETAPERFQAGLAESLSNLGINLTRLKRPLDALPHNKRAVRIYEALAVSNPDQYVFVLGRAMHNLSLCYWSLQRPDEAAPVLERAVQLRERLVQLNPDRFEPGQGKSLSNLCLQLAALGRTKEALLYGQHALRIFERLSSSNPARFEPDLARTLHNLSVCFWQLRRPGESLAAIERAVEIRNREVESNPPEPERSMMFLATALSKLGFLLAERGQPIAAMQHAHRAVRIHQRLTKSSPNQHEPDLIGDLWELGTRFNRFGQPEDRLLLIQWALQVYERLARTDPKRYESSLGSIWSTYGTWLADAGRPDDAFAVRLRAAEVLQRCHDRDRYEVRDPLGALLEDLASDCRSQGDRESARVFESRAREL
ncbi:tetratricopeptide repeat protein [Promicromonospora sp. NPDC057488]|uniref:tetratricopeptide repeat protein n=1 Tax=Promicromonospora sp. NPDC057488 TaxID=3346147 RepID=UPI00366DD02D